MILSWHNCCCFWSLLHDHSWWYLACQLQLFSPTIIHATKSCPMHTARVTVHDGQKANRIFAHDSLQLCVLTFAEDLVHPGCSRLSKTLCSPASLVVTELLLAVQPLGFCIAESSQTCSGTQAPGRVAWQTFCGCMTGATSDPFSTSVPASRMILLW